MSIAELGSLGEFIASIAVVASVLYLAVQIRTQKGEQQQRAAEALAHAWGESSRAISENSEVADFFYRGLDDYDALDSIEKLRFSAVFTAMLKAYEAIFYLREEGALEEEAWSTTEEMVGRLCNSGGFKGYWVGRAAYFRPAFRNKLETMHRSATHPGIKDLYQDASPATEKDTP